MLGLTWTRVDDDLTVAARGGAHAGYIDRRAQGYVVFDQHSRYVDTFGSLGAARAALGDPEPAVGSWIGRTRELCARLRLSPF